MKRLVLILIIVISYLPGFSQKSGTFYDVRDGKTYKTIKIGRQWIMAENFAYIPKIGKYKAYKNDIDNVQKLGYLYNWEGANNIAPEGWHLPSIEEWEKMGLYARAKSNNEDIRKTLSAGECIGLDSIRSSAQRYFISDANNRALLDGNVEVYWSSSPYWDFLIWYGGTNVSKNSFNNVRLFKDMTDYDTWDWTKTIGSIAGYKEFLNSYPNSIYADSAAMISAQIIKDRTENCKNIKTGMAPKELISLLGFEDKVNKKAFGGLFVGIGLLKETEDSKSMYTGIAVLNGYAFTLINGELTEWKIIENEINTGTFHGEINNDKSETVSKWSIDGDKYNIEIRTK
jgi:uncharacterized protein (TIGR02145 family)